MAPVPVKYDCLYSDSVEPAYPAPTRNEKPRTKMTKNRAGDMKAVLRKADAVCFDVDSTVCVDEGIDELARFCGVADEVKRLTARAMNGGVTYRRALSDRLEIIKPNLEDITSFVRENPPKLTNGIKELVDMLHDRGVHVYLVSGGFESVIIPVARELNIPEENIFANKILFYHNGEYAGFDVNAPTSESGGKIRVAEYLRSKNGYENLVFVGDGVTDLETFPTANAFIGFGGNKVRDNVKAGAPWFVHSFQEIIDVINGKS